jgi:predicted nucleic acid-binding protein
MRRKPFLDTNVLVYAYSLDDRRSDRATTLIHEGGIVSVHVLNEFVDVSKRKLRFSWAEMMHALNDLSLLLEPPLPLTLDLHRDAVDISRRYGFRIYDSLILSAAKAGGCPILYTEDLQNGQAIEGVLVRNPFTDA